MKRLHNWFTTVLLAGYYSGIWGRSMKKLNYVLALAILLLLTVASVVARENQTESQADPCLVYGSMERPQQEVQLFTLDLRQNAARRLGTAMLKAHVPGLAVHPVTKELYALVVNQTGAKATALARIDLETGMIAWSGQTGLDRLEGLSFRPTDTTLWAWSQKHGLIRLDPATAAVEFVQASNLQVSALAWDPAGDILYLAGNRSLWAYEAASQRFRLVTQSLPVSIGGLAMRGDGQLLITAAHPKALTEGLELLVFDPALGAVAATLWAPAMPVDPGPPKDENAARIEALTWPLACGNPSPGGEAELIQDIQIDKLAVCVGDTIHIQVETVHPEGGDNPVLVSINGLPGNDQIWQLDGAYGPRLINVSAWTAEGYADRESRSVEALDCGPGQPFASLFIGMSPFHPYVVDLLIANADEIAPQGAQYQWEFGDGVTANTDVPFISHSYEPALPPNQEYVSFVAEVTVQLPDGTALQTQETVTIWNEYAANRERGLIQPPVTYQPELIQSGPLWQGEYTLRNLEQEPITLTGRQLELQPCDPASDPVVLPWETLSLSLGPGEELTAPLELEAAAVPADSCGVVLHLVGQAALDRRVGVDLYFQLIRNPMLKQPESDQATLAFLNDIAAQGLVPDPDYITDEDLYRLAQEGRVVIPSSTGQVVTAARSRMEAAPALIEALEDCDGDSGTPNPIGCRCDRGDLPPPNLPGNVGEITCQATEVFDRYPPHLPNALKGDVVLVGGCGVVGEMLKILRQRYVHTGIMTKNYVEIAHSTSTDRRAANEAHLNYLPSPHIEARVLRYGWPGAIRADVGSAFSRLELPDPDGDIYALSDFGTEPAGCPGTIVPPLVVKPPPALAQSVRPKLQEAADIAREHSTPIDQWTANDKTGTGNYRFYAYSDGAIALNPGYDHPAGESSTVCSVFVWQVLREAGATLEGFSLEGPDRSKAWDLDPSHDGLYLYSEADRRSGGQLMWDYAHDQVMKESWFDPLYDVIADGIANQLVNCFARDQCDFWDIYHQDWKNPGDGRSVSPDNILLWDPPPEGVYGYSERLVYRSGGWERVYRWAPSAGTGSVTGVVNFKNQPMADASVILEAAGGLETVSGPDGRFRFLAVPAGTYGIQAQKQLPAVFLSSRGQSVTVVADGTAAVVLDLLPPAEDLRQVRFQDDLLLDSHYYAFSYRDTEIDPGCFTYTKRTRYGHVTDGEGELVIQVDKYWTQEDNFWWQYCLGDSCLKLEGTGWYDNGEIQEENGVKLEIHGKLDSPGMWGGTDEETRNLYLAPGESQSIGFYLEMKDWCWPPMSPWPVYELDYATVKLKLTNTVQNYWTAAPASRTISQTLYMLYMPIIQRSSPAEGP